jgi:iturin family lipopeptide synthetase A
MANEQQIAIIGMAFRFPGSESQEQLWQNVRSGATIIHQFTDEELVSFGVPEGAYRADGFMAASGTLPDIAGFDAEFFGMSGREADLTEPQQRMFLECCYHALEEGGYAAPQKGIRIGVYASAGYVVYPLSSYLLDNVPARAGGRDWAADTQIAIGNASDFMATRTAFRLGLTGPAMNVQTSCSSSLVAVHLACQAIRSGDTDLALAGAAAVHVPQVIGYQWTRGSILSPDGQCRAFDADANGTVGGNGVAAVLLKRLDHALADGDTVHAVIEGSGITNDGSTKQAFSAPSAAGQRDAVLQALKNAGVTARDIGYIETHGTGTHKGDRIEFEGLVTAFRRHTDECGFCALGTSKPAIGHLDACSGLASLIKAVLVLRHGEIPPLPNFRRPNPLLPLDDSPFYLPTRPQAWPRSGGVRRAGVHTLGIGGTNVHLIVAEPPDSLPRRVPGDLPAPELLLLSGHTKTALKALARAHRDHLRSGAGTGTSAGDLVTTTALGRRHLTHRLAAEGKSPADLAERLDAYLTGHGQAVPQLVTGTVPNGGASLPGFLFTGQGSPYRGMARLWYTRFPIIRAVLDEAEEAFRLDYGESLLDPLLARTPESGAITGDGGESWPTSIAQPALFALQAALVQQWIKAGVRPGAVAGHSLGEYAALYAAGALTFADGLRLTAARGRLVQDGVGPGAMLAVFADGITVEGILAHAPAMELAAVNGRAHHVLAGSAKAADMVCARLEAQQIRYHRLPVTRAFHTTMLEPVLEKLEAELAQAEFKAVDVAFISGVDGHVRPAGWKPDAGYLVQQARKPVRFDLVLAALNEHTDITAALEIGPDAVLTGLARAVIPTFPVIPTQRCNDELKTFWAAVARLHCCGLDLNWSILLENCEGRRIPLPSYPFQHVSHWAQSAPRPRPVKAADPAPALANEKAYNERNAGVNEHVLERVTKLAARILGCPVTDIASDRAFVDLGADSLQMVNMLRELEQDLHVRVTMRELLEDAGSAGRLAQLITTRIPSKPAPAPIAPTAAENLLHPPPATGSTPAGRSASASPSASAALARLEEISRTISTAIPAAGSAAMASTTSPARTADPAGNEAPVNHGPRVSVPVSSGMASDSATTHQREHLAELIRRYTARTPTSRDLAQKFRPMLADSRAVVGFRRSTKRMQYPIVSRRASGAWLEDVDGNRYLDITMGFGVLLFGHEPQFIAEPVQEHLSRGIQLGTRIEQTGEVVELLSDITGMDRVAFACSGTEANSAAIRLARAATGRDTIVMFSGSYHGHADNVLGRAAGVGTCLDTIPVSNGIPHNAVADLVVLEYDSPASLKTIEQMADKVAAVLVEPVQSRRPGLQPEAFLTALRDITQRHGIVLVFDEMLTGFRPHLLGAQGYFGVKADLATYGKPLGGGFPIGAVAGRADIMDGVDGGFWQYDDDSYPPFDTTFFFGTYIQHPVSMVAAKAVLEHLKEHSPALQQRLNARTQELAQTLNRFFIDEEFPLRMRHFGSMFRFEHAADMDLFYYHLLLRGILVWEWRSFFLSTSHTDTDVELLVNAVTGSLRELRDAGFLRPTSGTSPRRPATLSPLPPSPTPAAPPVSLPAPVSVPKTPACDSSPATATITSSAHTLRQPSPAPRTSPDFSLYFFGDYPHEGQYGNEEKENRYELLLESARFADENGFHALWLPERHFDSFGGLFPNPAVLASALAVQTRNIRLNAGSVVLPLHDPIRVAEEWSMVDNLSGGRAGIGCASGWHANDFVFFPDRYGRHREMMYQQLDEVRQLWSGQSLKRRAGDGETHVQLFPRPVQTTIPMFAAIVGRPESYQEAARHDLGIVTNLMTQSVEQLAQNIALYRASRAEHGLDPDAGRVVVLLHTYLSPVTEQARAEAREPLFRYMRASLKLFSQITSSLGQKADLDSADATDLDYLFQRAYDRYCAERALIGSPASCIPVVDTVRAAGANEVAALVDFGMAPDQLRAGLPQLDLLRRSCQKSPSPVSVPERRGIRTVLTSPGGENHSEPPSGLAEPSSGTGFRTAPATQVQRRLWMAARLGSPTAYNELQAVRLRGPLDPAALQAALRAVVDRHDGLRTVFRPASPDDETSGLQQVVLDRIDVPCPLSDCTGQDPRSVIDAAQQRASQHVYDLATGPLLTAEILRLAPDEHALLLGLHHIITDSRSAEVLAADLSTCYQAALEGRVPHFEHPAGSCLDIVEPDRGADDLSWWREQLGSVPPILWLATDRPRGRGPGGRGASVTGRVSSQRALQLREWSSRQRVTLYATLSTAWQIVLWRFSGQDDFLLGTTFGERSPKDEHTVGFFVSLLPLRCTLSDELSVRQAVRNTRDTLLEAWEHAWMPFDRLVTEVNPDPGTSRPLTPVGIDFDTDGLAQIDLPGIVSEHIAGTADSASLELMLQITRIGDELSLRLKYDTSLYDADTAHRYLRMLEHVLKAISTNESSQVKDVAELSEPDALRLRKMGRGVALDSTAPLPGTRLPARGPEPAVIDGDTVWSRDQLYSATDTITARLVAHGVGGDDLVAISLPKSPGYVASILGVVTVGAAYLPLDVSQPRPRLAAIVADAQPSAIICDRSTRSLLSAPSDVHLITVDDFPAADPPPVAATPHPDPADLLYVMYTSGSTGVPKGVEVSYGNLACLLAGYQQQTPITADDRLAWYYSPAFDVSQMEIWPALTSGVPLYLVPERVRLDPEALADWFADQRITVAYLPPALGEMLLDLPWPADTPLRQLCLGGEKLNRRPRPGLPFNVINCYGPTETTFSCVWGLVSPNESAAPPIGLPRPQALLEIRDHQGRLLPQGAVGELHIGGPQVARGYRRSPELTEQRFRTDDDGVRWYNSGDLARWRSDGQLEFCGRSDHQVQIRGFRVEPAEVTGAVLTLAGISDAIVVGTTHPETGLSSLTCYVCPLQELADESATIRFWRSQLANLLPRPMVPEHWIVTERLPLAQVSGKRDPRAIPTPSPAPSAGTDEMRDTAGDSRSDRDSLTATVRTAWQEVLGTADVPDDAPFFDLGGHSLLVIKLLGMIERSLGTKPTLADFFDDPTVTGMVNRLSSQPSPGSSPARRRGQL